MKAKPIQVPLYTMIRIGRGLGLSAEQAMNAARLSRAAQEKDPTHPGYTEAPYKPVGLGRGKSGGRIRA